MLSPYRPWHLRLAGDLELLAPKSGPGALIYYQGHSEPATARFLASFLRPGMKFWDVGAHFGEFSLVASKRVGETGQVVVFEPQPRMFGYLARNVQSNRARNVALYQTAVCDTVGRADLFLPQDPSLAFLNPIPDDEAPMTSVETTTLDQVCHSTGCVPDLVKVDVEGAELAVLQGSECLAARGDDAPTWIVEYEPENCVRFKYQASDLTRHFRSRGYSVYWLSEKNYLTSIESALLTESAGNFVATKRSVSEFPR
jgi:FkbM family methyltransferase